MALQSRAWTAVKQSVLPSVVLMFKVISWLTFI